MKETFRAFYLAQIKNTQLASNSPQSDSIALERDTRPLSLKLRAKYGVLAFRIGATHDNPRLVSNLPACGVLMHIH
jgi:hypothetical protein